MPPKDRFCLIATIKDEGPWLLEWVAHNKAVGFDNIVVAWNDCSDGSDLILKRLEALGHLRQIENKGPFEVPIQDAAYALARETQEVQRSEWVMCMDADEFLNIHLGKGTLDDLLEALPDDTEAVLVQWRHFGDSGFETWPGGLLCETLTAAQAEPDRHTAYKTLFRRHRDFEKFWIHMPWTRRDGTEEILRVVVRTTSGKALRKNFFMRNRPDSKVARHLRHWQNAQINHYAIKTPDLYKMKQRRGRAGKKSGKRHSGGYYRRFNQNEVQDTSLDRTREARHAILAEFLSDSELKRLHEAALATLPGAAEESE